MHYPTFYTQVPTIKLYDPLSEFLGAFSKGELDISYLDCVKLAGHSCPTVAGAYLMAQKGLKSLYPDTLAQRGNIKIEMQHTEDEGVTGVTATVLAFILGANDVRGFKGIQNQFKRNHTLFFDTNIKNMIKLTRMDTLKSVSLSYDPSVILADEMLKPLMAKNLQKEASLVEQKMFHALWQERVEAILLSTDLHEQIITLH